MVVIGQGRFYWCSRPRKSGPGGVRSVLDDSKGRSRGRWIGAEELQKAEEIAGGESVECSESCRRN